MASRWLMVGSDAASATHLDVCESPFDSIDKHRLASHGNEAPIASPEPYKCLLRLADAACHKKRTPKRKKNRVFFFH